MRFTVVFITAILLFTGCRSTPPPLPRNALAAGMPRHDVLLLMGTPQWINSSGKREVMEYHLHKDIAKPYEPDEPYWVLLEDGHVIKFGKREDFGVIMDDETDLASIKMTENR